MIKEEILRGNNLITGSTPLLLEEFPKINYKEIDSAGISITGYYWLNTRLRANQPLKIIYVLPVQSLDQSTFGNGIDEVKSLIDENKILDNVLFIQPKYKTTPWYANHPTTSSIQQETDTVDIFDLINERYSMFPEKETYLLGFSKSGWGAMNILLRYPQYVDGIHIWDSPLALNSFITSDMSTVFGNLTYLQENYYLNDVLISNNQNLENKLIYIGGYNLWQTLSDEFVTDLSTYPNINYIEDDTLNMPHVWNKTWIEAVLSNIENVLV